MIDCKGIIILLILIALFVWVDSKKSDREEEIEDELLNNDE